MFAEESDAEVSDEADRDAEGSEEDSDTEGSSVDDDVVGPEEQSSEESEDGMAL